MVHTMSRGFSLMLISFFSPPENGEDIQVLRYEEGQRYEPHYDYFTDKVNIVRGGHRLATVLMYLSDVEKGGETVFPEAEVSLCFYLFLFLCTDTIHHIFAY